MAYLVGFIALWFHMTHGFWSMFQSIGWDSTAWIPRLKKISDWWTTIVVGLFAIQAVVFYVQAQDNFYINDKGLEKQYIESFQNHYKVEAEDLDPMSEEAQVVGQKYQQSLEKFIPTIKAESEAQQKAQQEAQQKAYEEYMKQQAAQQEAATETNEEPQN